MRVVFMGTPEFAVPALRALIDSPYQVAAVYTQPDTRAGRGQQVTTSPVKEVAIAQGIPLAQPETLKEPGIMAQLSSFNPEVIVVAAFGHILPPQILDLPKFGCLNIHPSLLPRHRGPSPVAAALLHGDEVTGVTIMLMDAGLDTGPILAQRKVSISPEDITGSLTEKLAEVGAQLLMETLPLWSRGEIRPQPQDESQATYTRVITKKEGEIDWHLSAWQLWRQVRAFSPWPGCYTWWQGRRLRIIQAVPLPGTTTAEVRKVIALTQPSAAVVGVGTGDGILGLCRVQLEGKREMTAAEFVRGQRDFIGASLGCA